MPTLKSISTAKDGDTFAVRIKNGLYIACRVIADTSSESNMRRKKKFKTRDAIRMVCCNWFGPKPPDPNVRELREVLRLSHHWFKNKPLAGWCSEDIPRDVVHIGVVPSDDSESRLGTNDCLDWNYLRWEAQQQWDWDHDREAVIAADRAEEADIERRDAEWLARDKQALASLTLEQLSKHRFLKEWESPLPTTAIRISRKLLRDTAKSLLALGDAPTAKDRLAVLQACIEEFNALDEKHRFIDTTEREDICDAFDLLVRACGLALRKNLADKWREW